MYYFLALSSILLALVVFLLLRLRELGDEIRRLEQERKIEQENLKQASGLNGYNEKLRRIKEERKGRILELIKEKGKVKNKQVAKALEISTATVTRYLEELRQENKVEQIGKVGRGVYYVLK